MSDVVQPNQAGEFRSHFDTPPGLSDANTRYEKRQQWYAKLFAEGVLRSEEEKARLEQILAEEDAQPIPTMEELYAQVDDTTTFERLIEEIERDAEKEA